MLFKKIFKKIYYILITANKVAKLEGVVFGKNPKFRTKLFGSEPYLINIGDDFETASNVSFVTHDGGVGVLRNMHTDYTNIDMFKRIIIGNNVFVGLNSVILPGSNIGNNIIIGAGSIVRGRLESNSVYAGIPAKYIMSINEYKDKNKVFFINTFHLNQKEKELYIKYKTNILNEN